MTMVAAPPASGPRPAEGPSVIVERPPPGLLRGKAPAPEWVLVALGLIALLVVIAFYVRRFTRRRAP